ncbi:MAG TPA: DUF1648 domain-containing protein [Terracidiphilus sp.]|jgi:uncharacterized membrane protein
MRKTLETISLAILAGTAWITWQALHGSNLLPERIPTHFNSAGNPDGWGPASTLLVLPAVAVGLYLFISLLSLFPALFKTPVRVTEENRVRLQALNLQMVAWLKLELVCLFAWIQWTILQFARQGHGRLTPAFMVIFLAAVLVTALWHILAMARAAQPVHSVQPE